MTPCRLAVPRQVEEYYQNVKLVVDVLCAEALQQVEAAWSQSDGQAGLGQRRARVKAVLRLAERAKLRPVGRRDMTPLVAAQVEGLKPAPTSAPALRLMDRRALKDNLKNLCRVDVAGTQV